MKSFRAILSAIAVACLAACATTAPIREYLDDDTAAAITVSGGSFVFARERFDLAVHAQDYLTITPLQVNRSGQRIIYLYCQIWSTIDRRDGKSVVPEGSPLTIVADDREIPLPATATDIRGLGLGHPPIADQHANEIRVVAIERDLLRFVLSAGELRLALGEAPLTQYFTLWHDGRNGINEFLTAITPTSRPR